MQENNDKKGNYLALFWYVSKGDAREYTRLPCTKTTNSKCVLTNNQQPICKVCNLQKPIRSYCNLNSSIIQVGDETH